MTKYFVEKFENIDLNLVDGEGKTPFHYLCSNDNIDIYLTKYFVENIENIDLNLVDGKGMTPFHYLCSNDNIDIKIVNYFLDLKSNPYLESNEGWRVVDILFEKVNNILQILNLKIKDRTLTKKNQFVECIERKICTRKYTNKDFSKIFKKISFIFFIRFNFA